MIQRKEWQGSDPEERKAGKLCRGKKGREVMQKKERQGSYAEERKAGK